MKDWTRRADAAEGREIDDDSSEGVVAKGALSRHRTIVEPDEGSARDPDLHDGTVTALRGLYAEVDDGTRTWLCAIRRVLRTRQIDNRSSVTVGDRVRFRVEQSGDEGAQEGMIEHVAPRHGELRRKSGHRVHTIAANVDQVLIVTSVREPRPKPNLIDRYIVTALAHEITPVICVNKIDLDLDNAMAPLISRYRAIGHTVLVTSAVAGVGVDELRQQLKNSKSVVAGQSGVGKSSLLNCVQPGLELQTGSVTAQTGKGRHTTTTARLLKLDVGGYVVDTPGIRSFDLTMIPRNEYEACFVEFVEFIRDCRYPDCTHTHEDGCAVKQAVARGHIAPERYRNYVQIFENPGIVE